MDELIETLDGLAFDGLEKRLMDYMIEKKGSMEKMNLKSPNRILRKNYTVLV